MELIREPYEEHIRDEELDEERIADDSNDEFTGNRERSNTSPPPSIFTSPPSQPISPNTVDSTYASLPSVPTHDPRLSQKTRHSIDMSMIPSTGVLNRTFPPLVGHVKASSPILTPRHLSASSGSGSVGNPATLLTPDEGQNQSEEEELEELEDTDDEVEEMAEEHDLVRVSEEVTSPDRLETKQLVEWTRSVCLSFVQTVLHNMNHNTVYIKLIGGNNRMDKLSRAADETSNQIIQSAIPNPNRQDDSKVQQSFERLAVLVVNAVDEVESVNANQTMSSNFSTAMEDLKLVKVLSTLLASLDPENVQDILAQSRSPSSSTMPTEYRQRAGIQMDSISGSSSGDLRSPTTSPHWNNTSTSVNANNNLTSSPSSSREELRNPFADDELRISQSGSSSVGNASNTNSYDEKWRDRTLILGGSTTSDGEAQKLIRLFDEIEKRCHSSTNERGELIAQTSNAASLQAQIGAGRSLLVTRRSESLTANPIRHRSASPSSPSPTFGISQINSRTSSPAFNTAQTQEQVIGDPTGEALAAGMMGNIGSVSRSTRNSSNRNSISFIPTTPSLARRNSTKSERSFGLHSPPPRYSEDSTRSWANTAFPPLTGQDAAVSGLNTNGLPTSTGVIRRRRSISSDVLPGFSTGPPAYAREAFQNPSNSMEEKGGSMASLATPSDTSFTTTTGGGRISSKAQFDEKEALIGMDEEAPARVRSVTTQPAINPTRSMHPAHELKMLQNGIDRLMDAAPQMNDQRVGLPDPNRRAQQRESDLRQMVERMSKTRRLDDQRATLPPSKSMSPIGGSPLYAGMPRETVVGEGGSSVGVGLGSSTSIYATNTQIERSSPPPEKSVRTRRFPSVGSISLGSLAIRRASHILENGVRNVKGKDRQEPKSPGLPSPTFENRANDDYADLESVTSRLASASMRGLNDQRVAAPTKSARKGSMKLYGGGEKVFNDDSEMTEITDSTALTVSSIGVSRSQESQGRISIDSFDLSPPPVRRGKSKLASMGIETGTNYDDDPLFEMINASTSGRRMSDQDVIIGRGVKQNSLPSQPASLKTSHSRLLRNIQPNEIDLQAPSKTNEQKISAFERSSEGDYASAKSTPSGGELKTSMRKNDGVMKQCPDAVEHSSIATDDLTMNKSRKFLNAESNKIQWEFACIAETQEHLGWLVITVWNAKVGEGEVGNEISYEILRTQEGGGTLSLIIQSPLQKPALRIDLPACAQESESIHGTISKQGDRWLLRLPLDKDLLETSYNQFSSMFSSTQILKLKPTQWECVWCANPIIDTSSVKKYISLPSQHWEELVDAWMCHTDQELNESLLQAQKNIEQHAGLLEKGHVHVSDTELIMPGGVLKEDRLVKRKESEIVCKECQSTIGHMGNGQISKMFKYAIRPLTDNSALKYPSFVSFMADELVRRSQISASRNFVVTNQDENGSRQKRIALWLFLDDFQISLQPGKRFNELVSLPNTFKACKVMFRIPEEVDEDEEKPNDWTSPGSEEPISYPSDWFERLLSVLKASNESYPLSQRIFTAPTKSTSITETRKIQSWHTGFLPRM